MYYFKHRVLNFYNKYSYTFQFYNIQPNFIEININDNNFWSDKKDKKNNNLNNINNNSQNTSLYKPSIYFDYDCKDDTFYCFYIHWTYNVDVILICYILYKEFNETDTYKITGIEIGNNIFSIFEKEIITIVYSKKSLYATVYGYKEEIEKAKCVSRYSDY